MVGENFEILRYEMLKIFQISFRLIQLYHFPVFPAEIEKKGTHLAVYLHVISLFYSMHSSFKLSVNQTDGGQVIWRHIVWLSEHLGKITYSTKKIETRWVNISCETCSLRGSVRSRAPRYFATMGL